MTDLPPEELLSAYVDGELSLAERRRVEAHLATSAQSRQLVDELRALSQLVRSLPRQTIGTDLSARVVRRAEAERQGRAEPAPATPPDATVQPAQRPHRRSLARPLVWSGLAVAAAWMVMVLTQQPANDRAPMAQRSGAAKLQRDQAARAAPAKQDKERVTLLSGQDRAAAGQRADHGVAVVRPAPAEPVPMAAEAVAAKAAGAGGALAAPAAAPAEQPVTRLRRAKTAPARVIAGTVQPDKGRVAAGSAGAPAGDILVVHLAVHRPALRRQAVTAVLVHQGIAWEGPPAPDQERQPLAELAERIGATAGRARTHGRETLADLVYVEATPAQVAGAIAEFERKPAQFAEVSLGRMSVDQLRQLLPVAADRNASGVVAGLPRAKPSTPEQAETKQAAPALPERFQRGGKVPETGSRESVHPGWQARAQRLPRADLPPSLPAGRLFADKGAAVPAPGRDDAQRAQEGSTGERGQQIRREELGRLLRQADRQREVADESAGATDAAVATGRPVQVLLVVHLIDDSRTPPAAADENP